MRQRAIALALLCLSTYALIPTTAAEIVGGQSINVKAEQIRFAKLHPERAKFGELFWRGGITLESNDRRFGGFSGLVVSEDGEQIVAISDKGWWLTANLSQKNGKLNGISNAQVAPLLTKKGNRSRSKAKHDAEALAAYDSRKADGPLIVGFERRERLEMFNLDTAGFQALPSKIKFPKAVSSGPNNGEMEAIARVWQGPLAGWFIILSEKNFDKAGNIRGWRWQGNTTVEFTLKQHQSYRVTDMAILPGSEDIVTLERSFLPDSLPGMLVRRFQLTDLEPGRPARGQVLLEATQPYYAIDNMEGLAVHQTEDGETRLTIISDDNYNSTVQSTLLLQFALPE